MTDRIPEGLDRLARQDAPRSIGDRAGDHDRQAPAEPLEALVDRKERRLRVQGIEHGFNQQNVDTAFDQRLGLLDIGHAQLLEADVAGTRIIDVGRDRCGFGLWAECTGHETRLVGRAEAVGRLAGDAGRGEVHLAGELGHAVVGLRDDRRTKGIGLDDVCAGSQIVGMNLGNHLRTGDREQLVVAFDVVGEVGQPLAAVVGLGELVALDHGAHGAVEDQDAPGEQLAQADFDRTCGLIGRRQKSAGRCGHEPECFWQARPAMVARRRYRRRENPHTLKRSASKRRPAIGMAGATVAPAGKRASMHPIRGFGRETLGRHLDRLGMHLGQCRARLAGPGRRIDR